MASALQEQYINEGYKVVSKGENSLVIELPNSYQVNVPTNDETTALHSANSFYENVQKKDGTKDDLAWKEMLPHDDEFIRVVRDYYRANDSSVQNEDWFNDRMSVVDHWVNDMRWRDNNSISMAKSVMRHMDSYGLAGFDEKGKTDQKQRFSYLLNTWDAMPAFHQTGGSGLGGFIRNAAKAVVDPISYAGFGLVAVGKRFALTAAGKIASKEMLKNTAGTSTLNLALTTAGAEGLVGAAFNAADQSERINVGMKPEGFSLSEFAAATAISAVTGGVITAVASKAIVQPISKYRTNRAEILSSSRKGILVNNSIVDYVSKITRKTRDSAENFLTTAGPIGPQGAEILRNFAGEKRALGLKAIGAAKRTEDEIATAFEAASYNDVRSNPANLTTLNAMFDIVTDGHIKLADLKKDITLDAYSPQDMPSSPPLSSGVQPQFMPLDPDPKASPAMFGKIAQERRKRFAQEELESFSGKTYAQKVADADINLGGSSKADSDLAAKMLDNNPNLAKSLHDLADTQTKYRETISGNSEGDIFAHQTGIHQKILYDAFVDPDRNLKNIQQQTVEYKGEQLTIEEVGIRYIVSDSGVSRETARTAIGLFAQGQLKQAKTELASEISQGNTGTLKKLFGDADAVKTNKSKSEASEAEESEAMLTDILYNTTMNDAVEGATGKTAVNKQMLDTLKQRKKLPNEIRNVLGRIENDPVKRAYETQFGLGVLARSIETNNALLFTLIQSGQINKLGAAGRQILTRGGKDQAESTGLYYSRDGAIERLTKEQIADLPPAKRAFAEVQRDVLDGRIKNAQEFKKAIDNSTILREKAYTEMLDNESYYNPLALTFFDKSFKDAFDQGMYGYAPLKNATGDPVTSLSNLGFLSQVASISKTILSPGTTALNMIGGAVQGWVVLGATPRPLKNKAMNFLGNLDEPVAEETLNNVYIPIFIDLLKGQINKKSLGDILPTLTKKTNSDGTLRYTRLEVDSAFKLYTELNEANILDADMMSDTLRLLQDKSSLRSLVVKGFQTEELPLRRTRKTARVGFETAKRTYAAGDEFFKVVYYMDRRNYHTRLGATEESAVLKARRDVYRHLPNYRFQPGLFKTARTYGVGNFVSHTLEVTRNTKNIIVDSMTEIQEGNKLRKAGDKRGRVMIASAMARLGRLSVAVAGADYAVDQGFEIGAWAKDQIFGEQLGITEPEDIKAFERARFTFMPEYLQGSKLVPIEIDENGNGQYVDVTHMNPFGVIASFIPSIHKFADEMIRNGASFDEAYTEGFSKGVLRYLNPYLTVSLGLEPIKTALTGDPSDEDYFTSIGESFIKSFRPGFITAIDDFYHAEVSGATPKEYQKGPNGEPIGGWGVLAKQAGIKLHNFNLGEATYNTYRKIARDRSKAQRKFQSTVTREGYETTEDDVGLVSHIGEQFIDPIDLSNFRDEKKIDSFVEVYREANEERFIQERTLYGAMLSHATILRNLPKYKGDNREIALEIVKRATQGNVPAVPKALAMRLASAAAFQKAPPLYVPFLMNRAGAKKAMEQMLQQDNVDKATAQDRVRSLYSKTTEIAKQFHGRPLNLRLQTNE